MHIKLTEFGFKPYIIGTNYKHNDISFLKKNTNCKIIKYNFSEVLKNEYDILMVNSDQTWRKFDKHFYDIGFLKFAYNWSTPKFVYGASFGFSKWNLSKSDKEIVKQLLKNFTGISVREKSAVNYVKSYLGIKPIFVIDPTLLAYIHIEIINKEIKNFFFLLVKVLILIDKKYYLNIIKDYKQNSLIKEEKYIFTYLFGRQKNIQKFIKYASKKLGYKIYAVRQRDNNSIKKFIYGIANSNAVITNSFHGTVFSIMFKSHL